MNYIKTHLNLIFAVLFLIVAAIFFIAVYKLKFKNPAPVLNVVKTEVALDKLPELFPSDIPIEKGAKITQNYNATTDDGRFQATRTFETSQSLEANFKIYQDYFTKNNWTVRSITNEKDFKAIAVRKGNDRLHVSMNYNPFLKVNTIEISLTVSK